MPVEVDSEVLKSLGVFEHFSLDDTESCFIVDIALSQ